MENFNNQLTTDFENVYVIDTNIILHDAHNLELLSEKGKNLICIPEIVIDEIDNKKYGFDEINYQAREFARLLENAKIKAHKQYKDSDNGEYSIIEVSYNVDGDNEVILHMITKKIYKVDATAVKASITNDRKILEVAHFVQKDYKKILDSQERKITFLSLDILARTRAISMGLNTEGLLSNKTDEDFDFDFIKTIELESNNIPMNTLDGKEIIEIDPEYKSGIFGYIIKYETGHHLFALIINKRISMIDENELRKGTVKPKNTEQIFLFAMLMENIFQMTVVDSQAGSGKTLLSVAAGMRLLEKGMHSKIVYIRNSVESVDLKSEDIGFLPGSLDEKLKVYNHALYDSIEHIARTEVKKSNSNKGVKDNSERAVQEKMDEILAKYNIETMWPGELRGRTIQDSFIIVDEAQNFSKKGLATVLSRISGDCKVAVLGNWKQIDNSYLNKYSNGLAHLLSLVNEEYEQINLSAIKLNKVLRGPITEWVEEVFNSQSK